MNYLYILLFQLIIGSCNLQQGDNNYQSKNYQMEKFDLENFKKNQNGGHYNFILKEGTEVNQSEFPGEFYLETRRNPGSPFETYQEFHYDSLYLSKSGTEFYGFPVGVWKEFDAKGKVIGETNEDEPFRFSIEQLDEKMQKLKIYIMNQVQGITVSRDADENPVYIVAFPVSVDLSELIVMTIDGNTGKTLNQITKKRKENH